MNTIIGIGATNRCCVLNPAVYSDGWFEHEIVINIPDEKARGEMVIAIM